MENLREVISGSYGFNICDIAPANRGYWAETWKLCTSDRAYFVKLDYFKRHQKLFQNSLPVVEYLCGNGVDFIANVVKTRGGELFTSFNDAVLAVFDWIDGENLETDKTKPYEFQMLCEIYRLTKPGFNIPKAKFSDDMALRFYKLWEGHKNIVPIIERHKEKLAHYAARLAYFAKICRGDDSGFYLSHGDAGGNFMVSGERHYIVDWDEVMYAPPERDAWVMACRDWALKLFDNTLKRNEIPYKLRPERLAFYCYHYFFLYLSEFLEDFIGHGDAKEILQYFSEDDFIWERIVFADLV
jgi:Ser/Thr protein kinase RdoA (MazF antagonist)